MASLLWSAGIPLEYMPHSCIMLSLLKHFWSDANKIGPAAHEWTVEMICGICSILNIQYVVIVSSHLLRSKDCVKLHPTTLNSVSGPVYNHTGSEEIVLLSSLASLLLDCLYQQVGGIIDTDTSNINSTRDCPSQSIVNGDMLKQVLRWD